MAIDFLIGRKMGMTRVFDELGSDYPVTILEAGPCSITQIKTSEKDSYSSVQISFKEKSNRHLKKAEIGHFKKAGVSAKKILKEVVKAKPQKEDLLEDLNDIEEARQILKDF